ncbi:hypothetical protein MB46_05620 [Arthrobacter alpinus]|uniref:DUF1990 family protein n=1 Tax=Arthrobacter alpinus TaxID=656366 RepID=UPI0005CB33D1|nr:DUF1990 family protein [Arthrobacter alpinus]ALV45062.1 hypothetical protein MB46_05620 [Arthrobacter alpinus]
MTEPASLSWTPPGGSRRPFEITAVVGYGDDAWKRAAEDVLRWKVKTRSGFRVDSTGPVVAGERVTVTVTALGVTVVEPVEVVAVVQNDARVGFAYRTLPGHPVSGEEAFIVHRVGQEVRLTLRSLTRAAPQQPWRGLFPLLLLAQRIVRRRYLRALR